MTAAPTLVRVKGRLIRRDYTEFCHEIATAAAGQCQAAWSDKCWGRGDQVHHRLRRAHGGPDTHTNCRWVCTQCHEDIHRHPLEAYVRGLLVRSSVTDAERAHLEETDR